MNDYFTNISGFELLDKRGQRKITSHETGLEELDLVTYGFPTGTITDLFGQIRQANHRFYSKQQ